MSSPGDGRRIEPVARPQIGALTGLRFFAALHVFAFHGASSESPGIHGFVHDIAGCGYVAVSLFFVLSGFILTYVHARSGSLDIDWRRFYVARFARIYPAYAFALALIGPFFIVHTIRTEGIGQTLGRSVAVIALAQAYVPPWAMAWNPPGWSLSAEAFFYALFPWVAPRLCSCRRSTALAVGATCYAASLILPLVYQHLSPDGLPDPSASSQAFWLNVLRYGPLVRLPEFVIGIVAARIYLEHGGRALMRWEAELTTWLAVGALALVMARSRSIPYCVMHNGLLAPLFVALIVSLTARSFLASALQSRPALVLGEASYSFYVLQIPLLVLWSKVTGHIHVQAILRYTRTPLSFLLVVTLSSLLCRRYVEQPLRRRILSVGLVSRSS